MIVFIFLRLETVIFHSLFFFDFDALTVMKQSKSFVQSKVIINLKIVTAYYPTPAVGGGRIVYIEPVFKLNDYNYVNAYYFAKFAKLGAELQGLELVLNLRSVTVGKTREGR